MAALEGDRESLVKPGAEEWIAMELGHVIPFIEHAMHDTKAEVSQERSLSVRLISSGSSCCYQSGDHPMRNATQSRYSASYSSTCLSHGLARCCRGRPSKVCRRPPSLPK